MEHDVQSAPRLREYGDLASTENERFGFGRERCPGLLGPDSYSDDQPVKIDSHLIVSAKEKLCVSVAVNPFEAESRQHAQGAAEVAARDEQVEIGVGPTLVLRVHPARDRRALEKNA